MSFNLDEIIDTNGPYFPSIYNEHSTCFVTECRASLLFTGLDGRFTISSCIVDLQDNPVAFVDFINGSLFSYFSKKKKKFKETVNKEGKEFSIPFHSQVHVIKPKTIEDKLF